MGKPIENPLGKDVLENLYVTQKLSAIKIAKIYQRKPQQIYYQLSKYGIKRRSLQEMNTTFSVNDEYFNTIDNSEKAYWLGFLYADGFVSCRHQIGLALALQDLDHIQKFKIAIHSTHPIHIYQEHGFGKKEYGKLIFSSAQMARDLEKLGCKQKKSLTLEFPTAEQVPPQFLRDFARGYIDGDGSITSGGKAHPLRLKICGTREFLNGLKSYFETVLYPDTLKTAFEKRHDDDKNNFSLTVSPSSKALKILNELYKDSTVFLDRKHILYQEKIALLNSRAYQK